MQKQATGLASFSGKAALILALALILPNGGGGWCQEPRAQFPLVAGPDPVSWVDVGQLVPSYGPELGYSEYEPWHWQLLPDGLIYPSYLAGVKESRFAAQWVHDDDRGWIWDVALGGRVGVARFGTGDPLRPEGWQLDVEGAAFPRLDLDQSLDLISSDFRFGLPLTYGRGRHRAKLAYYHLSSHLGDEFMLRHPGARRINFSRDALVLGYSFYWTNDLRLYAEAGWAYRTDGGSRPWEFQFGVDYSPARPTGLRPAPFLAVNAHLREEVDYGGNLSVQTGCQWRGDSGDLFRLGMYYFAGKSDQYQFFDQYEDKVGLGLWYDY